MHWSNSTPYDSFLSSLPSGKCEFARHGREKEDSLCLELAYCAETICDVFVVWPSGGLGENAQLPLKVLNELLDAFFPYCGFLRFVEVNIPKTTDEVIPSRTARAASPLSSPSPPETRFPVLWHRVEQASRSQDRRPLAAPSSCRVRD